MSRTLSHARNAPSRRRWARTGSTSSPSPSKVAPVAVALLASLALACGWGDATPDGAGGQTFVWPAGPRTEVDLEIEGRGVITVELYPELAPKTVENFLELAREGFYTGTTFHRVIPEFMIQGGDPNTKDANPKDDGKGGPGYRIDDEHNAASHERGVLSMANSGHRNSGGSQFFIIQRHAPHLDGRHTIFGRVVRGLEIVDAIADVETDAYGRWGPRHRPIENQVIARVTLRDAAATQAAKGGAEAEAAEDPAGAG